MDDQALNDLLGIVIMVVAPLSICLLMAGLVSRALGDRASVHRANSPR